MKPNGRRRFRKMNARFRQRGSEVVSERARTTSAGKARKLILNDFWGGDGQRLRPCPGCLRCRSCVGCEVLTFEGDTCEDCGRETPMATESCDGSGVLPARRAKS